MKTYIIDWGDGCQGGRYALVQASCDDEAWNTADSIGGPFKIAELKIPKRPGYYDGRYMEVCDSNERYNGAKLDQLDWKPSNKTGIFKKVEIELCLC